MTSKADFQKLADIHADDARSLYAAGRYTNAYHLGGLAVECALKALVCDQFTAVALPDLRLVQRAHSHQLDELIGLAAIKAQLKAKLDEDVEFASNWSVTREWAINRRYAIITSGDAESFLSAAIEDNGVLPWIKTYW